MSNNSKYGLGRGLGSLIPKKSEIKNLELSDKSIKTSLFLGFVRSVNGLNTNLKSALELVFK